MSSLSEAESKKLLAAYDVPVVNEEIATDAVHAAQSAEKLGFPIVLKAHGSKLTHKSDRGLVRLGLADGAQVRIAAEEVAKAAGDDLEGFLLQPMLTGRREFVAGLMRDPMFGPIVMFGLGGVFTEALDDVVFRGAPIDKAEAEAMLDEIKA
ncbi:MAG: CoA-binding protein, partial [Desulfobulbaceae bacterium]|nr:CoA-binding protein [Desulfobulbaceae bacterium]